MTGGFPESQQIPPKPAFPPIPQMGNATKSAHWMAGCSTGRRLGTEVQVCGKQHPGSTTGEKWMLCAASSDGCATRPRRDAIPLNPPVSKLRLLLWIPWVFRKIQFSTVLYMDLQRPACAPQDRASQARNWLSHQNYHSRVTPVLPRIV